jgi:hypothetical protein
MISQIQPSMEPTTSENVYQDLEAKYPETMARLNNLNSPLIICNDPQRICKRRDPKRQRILGRPFGSDWGAVSADDQAWFNHYKWMVRLRVEMAKRETNKLSPEDRERYHDTFANY